MIIQVGALGFMTKTLTIGVYFFDTGGGHGSAAEATKAGIKSVVRQQHADLKVRILTQPIAEQAHPLIGKFIALYNHLARHHTTWIKYYYHLLHLLRLESNIYYGFYSSALHDLLKAQRPTMIVAIHPMVAEALVYARNQLHMAPAVKIAVIVTDPNEALWHAWACRRAELIIAPNEKVHRKLLEWGIKPDRIQVLGMPVHPKFLSPPVVPPEQFLTKLGLDPNVFTVCINCGWAGNAHLIDTYIALKKCKRKVQAIFLSGHNQQLKELALKKAKQTGIHTAVLPFYDQMSDLMSAADLMVTKAGGLTTYQALARRLPLVFDNTIEPMPMEEPTMRMLVKCGMAKKIDKPTDIVKIVDSSPIHPKRNTPLPQTNELNLTEHSIFNIARALLHLCEPEIFPINVEAASTAPHK